jgi:acetyl-CoA acetyltransferase
MHDYGAPREAFGMIAVNNRRWASQNPAAVKRTPITMDDYLNARMIRTPLGVLDMDLPVDGAEALVITSKERAKDLRPDPVFLHAMSLGQAPVAEFYENGNWGHQSPWKAFEHMWARSELRVEDVDLWYPYDGYTPIALGLTEAAGFAPVGEGWRMLQDSWNSDEQKLALHGRTRVQTGGGSLSHGRVGGTNYYTEAVHQLRGKAGEGRQVKDAKTALFGVGSYFHDPAAVLFRVD